MKLLQVIMAHTEAKETFDRHLPVWKSLGGDLVVTCPTNSIIETSEQVVPFGNKGHNGLEAIRRMKDVLGYMAGLRSEYDGLILHEYDSLSLELPPFEGIGANWMRLGVQDGYIARNCSHPPVAFTSESIKLMNDAMCMMSPCPEAGMWDRAFGLAMEKHIGMEHMNRFDYRKIGFSRNTIEEGHVPELLEALKNGAKHFHGVKNERILKLILEA